MELHLFNENSVNHELLWYGLVTPYSSLCLSENLPWTQHKHFGRRRSEDIRAQAPSAQGYRFSFSGPRTLALLASIRWGEEAEQEEMTLSQEAITTNKKPGKETQGNKTRRMLKGKDTVGSPESQYRWTQIIWSLKELFASNSYIFPWDDACISVQAGFTLNN